jgi:ABC-type Zn uptake system ZnuABC Zn-binding protein ZnuA
MNDTEAAHEVFGVYEKEFQYLFIPSDNYENITLPELGLNTYAPGENATPKQVAKHIRKFVKAKYK